MSDRSITYTGALIPNATLLGREKAKLLSTAALSKAVLGTNTVIDGLAIAPTAPASMQVTVGTGSIYSMQQVDATAFGDLGTDSHTVVKQGLLADPVTLTLTAPAASGYSQIYLVQAALLEQDGGSTVLPYYNAANPSAPLNGPANSGTSQFTLRQDICVVSLVAGAAAPTGSQTVPSPTPGYTPLYTILVANGQTTITTAAIAPAPASFFIPVKLPGVPSGVQSGQWVSGTASGTNTYTTTLFSTAAYPFALVADMEILVFFPTTNSTIDPTLNVNGTGAKLIIKQTASYHVQPGDLVGFVSLIYDGYNWRINGSVPSDFPNGILRVVDTAGASTSDALVGTTVPSILAYATGQIFLIRPAATNTTTTPTVNITSANGTVLGARQIRKRDGFPLAVGDLRQNATFLAEDDGFNRVVMLGAVPSDYNAPPPGASTQDAPLLLTLEATQAANVSVPTSVDTIIPFATTVQNNFATSTWNGQRLTIGAGEGGYVNVSAAWIFFTPTTGTFAAGRVKKNGAIVGELGHSGTQNGGGTVFQASARIRVAPGDYLEFYAYHQAGSSQPAYMDSGYGRTRFIATLESAY